MQREPRPGPALSSPGGWARPASPVRVCIPSSRPRFPWRPGLRVPSSSSAPRRRGPTTLPRTVSPRRPPLAASCARGRAVESSPRSPSRSPKQSHRRRHSTAPRGISGAAARVRPPASAGRARSKSGLARQGGAGRGSGRVRSLGPPLAPQPRPWPSGVQPGPRAPALRRGWEAGACPLRPSSRSRAPGALAEGAGNTRT